MATQLDLPPDAPPLPTVEPRTPDVEMADAPTPSAVQYSRLWGQAGELWDPKGRLRDFSRAGYGAGDRPLPTVTPTKSVKDFGARGDGTTNDTKAFQNAVASGGALRVPPGRYVLTDYVQLTKAGTILHGEGPGTTVLYFPKPLEAIYGAGTIDDGDSRWSFGPGFLHGRASEIGLEHLTIEFPNVAYRGHLKEAGYNAIQFSGVGHGWVRDLQIRNADLGVKLSQCHHCTVTQVVFTGRGGHHALWAYQSPDCLFTHFQLQVKYWHDLSIEDNTTRTVFANGTGVVMNLDHHAAVEGPPPSYNLFSNLNLGSLNRIWQSSGSSDRIRQFGHSGPGETFWNCHANGVPPSGIPGFGTPSGDGPMTKDVTIVGFSRTQLQTTTANEWVEGIPPSALQPPDLYSAQVARRTGAGVPPEARMAAMPSTVPTDHAVAFDGSASAAAAGKTLTYRWDFGDGTTAADAVTQHAYTTPGTYTVVLAVSDGTAGDTASATLEVTSAVGEIVDGLPVVALTASSSQDADHSPAMCRDGRLGTYWAASGKGQWLQCDLGAVRPVTGVAIAFYRGMARRSYLTVQVSTTGTAWTVARQAVSSGQSAELEAFPFPEMDARYVRLVGQGNSENVWNSYTEVRIDGPPPAPPAPVVLPIVAVTASSSAPGNEPTRATDGHLETTWIGADAGDWLTADLGAVCTVSQLDLAWGHGDARWQRFAVQASEDGTLWRDVHLGQSSGTTTAPEPVPVPDLAARYLRVIGLGNADTRQVEIADVQVWGTPAA